MPTGYHIERHAPQGPRTTWDVLVRKTSRTTSVAFSPVPLSTLSRSKSPSVQGKRFSPRATTWPCRSIYASVPEHP